MDGIVCGGNSSVDDADFWGGRDNKTGIPGANLAHS